MKIDLHEISDKNGNVDSAKIKKWETEGNKELGETPEVAKKICKAIGYDPTKSMKAEDFARKYMMVKVFIDLDIGIIFSAHFFNFKNFNFAVYIIDKNGFLDKQEISKHLNMDQNAQELKAAFNQFDINGDGKISVEEFLKAVESELNS